MYLGKFILNAKSKKKQHLMFKGNLNGHVTHSLHRYQLMAESLHFLQTILELLVCNLQVMNYGFSTSLPLHILQATYGRKSRSSVKSKILRKNVQTMPAKQFIQVQFIHIKIHK